MRKGLKTLRLVLPLLALAGSPLRADWHKAESQNFVLYGDMEPAELRQQVLRLESFDRLLRLRFSVNSAERQVPLTIYLLKHAKDVDVLLDRTHASGFFRSSRFGSFAVASTDTPPELEGRSSDDILQHEYTHFFFFRHLETPQPGWLIEGFAQYMGASRRADSGEWSVGLPNASRANALFKRDKLPLRTLLTAKPLELASADRSSFYAWSWLLTHMLYASPARQAQLAAYLAELARGTPSLAAAEKAFGDLGELDRALVAYRDGKLVSTIYGHFGDYAGPLAVSRLAADETQLMLISLDRKNGHDLGAARSKLAEITAATPAHAEAWFELALAERDLGVRADKPEERAAHFAASKAALDRVLTLKPGHVRANVLKADYLTRELAEARDSDPARWRDARAFLLKANEGDPDDPTVMYAWFESFLRQGRAPTQVAHDGLARAFALQPEVPELRIRYALDLAAQGQIDKAITVLQVMASNPHVGKQVEETLKQLEARRAGASAPAAS